MFNNRTPAEKSDLKKVITKLELELLNKDMPPAERDRSIDQLTKLYAMQSTTKTDRVSKDTLAVVAANLGGILIIVAYEQKHVIVSKGLSFVGKLR